jgi:uncharacterized protein (DUF2225 family)
VKRPERLELRLYRKLLQFYPAKFQREYGAEMLRTFSETLQDATLEGRLPSFWLESLVDAVSSLRRERRAARKENTVKSQQISHWLRIQKFSTNGELCE